MIIMKKMYFFLGLSALMGLFFASCEPTEHAAPTISVTNTNPIELATGIDSVTIEGTIVAEAGLDEVVVIKVTGLSEQQIGSYSSFGSGAISTSDDINYDINLPITGISEDITIRIEVTDKDDQTASQSVEIDFTALFEQSNVTLNAQANGPISRTTNESFLATADGSTYTLEEVSDLASTANIDIIFMRHSILKAGELDFSLRSPDNSGVVDYFEAVELDYPATMNTTKLKAVIDVIDWNDMDAADFESATSGVESGASIVDNVDDGDIFAFVTAAGKKGLIRVVQIVDPGDVSERYMKSNIIIDYKVEE
jgi:hypothetical protein